jgi:hypothetical protein
MTTTYHLPASALTPRQAVTLAAELLTFAEREGEVSWYITDPQTWDSLTPDQRHNIGLRDAEKMLADYLRKQADVLEGKTR